MLGWLFWRLHMFALRAVLQSFARLNFMRYQLEINLTQGDVIPCHIVRLASVVEGDEPTPIGLVTMTRAQARQYNIDASLGAYVRELLAADAAKRRGEL